MVQTDAPVAKAPLLFGQNLRITVGASQGGRKYMEDRCVVHTERVADGILDWTFLGVFDGHGGEHASEFVRRHLLMNITQNQKFDSENDEDILEAIRQGFLMTHDQMREVHDEWPITASGYPSTAGTTVSCVFIRNGTLYIGHVGDSAIFLGTVENGDLRARSLTTEHKPELATEQVRIAKAGGEVAVKSGVTRVVWKREQRNLRTAQSFDRSERSDGRPAMEKIPFLSVARSLGDLWSFNRETNMFVVSPEPDLAVHKLTGNDFCLVLASDGMTNVLTGEQAVSIVFKEEDMVEMNDEMNRNHSRCVLRTALQKWRSLRADNVTVATVIFDLEPMEVKETEIIHKIPRYTNCSSALSQRPDAMLLITRNEAHLLKTQRTPIIYNGSKDANFARVLYKGPGFRTHEEELLEERRNIMNKFAESAIAIAGGPADAVRGDDEENVEYDDNEDEEDEDEEEIDLSVEMGCHFNKDSKSVTMVASPPRPPRPHAPLPVFNDDSIFEPNETCESGSTDKKATPVRTPPGNTVRRVKAEAVRRLRTPKIPTASTSSVSITDTVSPDKRITRSATKASSSNENSAELKTPSPKKPSSARRNLIGVNANPSPDAILLTPRRSNRLNGVMSTPIGIADPLDAPESAKLTQSRKRGRTDSEASTSRIVNVGRASVSLATGVTPVVSSLSLQDQILGTPSRSAPSTPKKAENKPMKVSRWSLSKLDERKKKQQQQNQQQQDDDGIIRVSEVADEDEEMEDVMREPPSKIRRFYGYMRKFIWGK